MRQFTNYILSEKIYVDNNITVHRGYRISDHLPVIVKQPNSEHPDLNYIMSLKHEYEFNKLVNSNYIMKTLEIFEHNNVPLLVLEDFGGDTLRNLFSLRKITLREFLTISLEISFALSEIHKADIAHNAINPDNIIVNYDKGIYKITNLSIATLLTKENKNTDNFHTIERTLAYISPEQTGRMNRSIDYRTDFYSLGITLYEMLLGYLPYSSDDELDIIYSHLAKIPISPNKINNSIPKAISDIIMKLLEKMAENRYQSALGLINDLQECITRLDTNGEISDFQIGLKDFTRRFNLPQKLYGRESETRSLFASFEKASKGSLEIVTVSGYPGVGKSSLVNEIHKSVVKNKGLFAMGKYDQLNYDISYSALIQLFEDIVHEIISESKEKVSEWKNKILEQVGQNGKIIINVIPSLELIIGKQPDVPNLPPTESQNRFNLVFRNFVKCFCCAEHPLVMFLDDMQWCDLPTLKLIESLIYDKDTKYLLLIMTYRDNEVYGAHPLMLTLDNINKNKVYIKNINIKPLKKNNVVSILEDTLHIKDKQIDLLAELCIKKTEGNPFFLNQFLHLLHQENLIWFDLGQKLWCIDIEKIEDADITDNVVEFLINKIKKLDTNIQEILTLSACIGNKFDFETLYYVSKKSKAELQFLLDKAVIEGLITVDKSVVSYSFDDSNDIVYIFTHDRIQQASYNFIKEVYRKDVHLELGRLIFNSTVQEDYEIKVFDILNHYNIGINLVTDPSERSTIAELELFAGRKAQKAVAYEMAYKYFKAGISLLQDNCWENQYDLSLALYTEAAETAYLCGCFDEMIHYSNIVKNKASTILDKVKASRIIVQAYAAQGRISEAVDIAVKFIKLLGENIPRNPGKINVLFSLLATKMALQGKNIEELSNLPVMSDKYYQAILSILSLIGSISYRSDPMFMSIILIKALKFSLENGNTYESPFFYSGYGLVSCSIGQIETGYQFSKLATNLLNKLDVKEQKARIIFMNNAFITHWKEPVSDLLPRFKEGYQCGIEAGDYEFAAYNGFYYCNKSFYAGKNLEALDQEMVNFSEGIKNLKQEPQLYLNNMMHQLVQNLRGKNENPTLLVGEVYNEKIMLTMHAEANDNTAISSVYIIKMMLSYLFCKHISALGFADLTEKHIDGLQSTIAVPTYHYFSSLTKLALYTDSTVSEKKKIIKSINNSLRKMKKWADHCPENHLHKYYLIQAEKFKVLHKDQIAVDLYNRAIELSAKNNFIQDEALSNELLAIYYLSKNNIKLSRYYMEAAYYSYKLWGAYAKADDLERKYSNVLSTDFSDRKTYNNGLNANNKNSATSAILDTATILKATQAISGEIKLEELLKKLIEILHQNSGAQKVIFIMKQNSIYKVTAEGHTATESIKVMLDHRLDDYENLPKKIINYVIHSKKPLIVDNPFIEDNYLDDIYIIENMPKSILCMPIINKTNLSGILYLENNLIEGAFSPSRLEILKVISGQLAISIDNANMYQNLENLNNELEQKVYKRTMKLKELLDKVYTLLDNSGEGFLSFDRDFIIDSEYSSECKLIFKKDIGGCNVLELLFSNDQDNINSFIKSINVILETNDEYRREILLSLLPSFLIIDSKYIKIKYKILENLKIMLILTDITREKELEEKVKEEQDRLKLIVSSYTNKSDFFEIIDDYKQFMDEDFLAIVKGPLSSEEKLSEIYRTIHTFKGIFSQFSFINLPKKLDKLETSLTILRKDMTDFENKINNLFKTSDCNNAFLDDMKIITDILGDYFSKERNRVYLDEEKILKLENAADVLYKSTELLKDKNISEAIEVIKTLHFKSLKEMLESYPDYTLNLADRLDKCIKSFTIEGSDVLVDPIKYSPFVKSLIHVFRNAADHGIETPDERLEQEKDEIGHISCIIKIIDDKITIIIEDDGRGIDITKVKRQALQKSLISTDNLMDQSEKEMINLIFLDNLSTEENISETSGRGYGLSAVKNEAMKLNGKINVESFPGKGTKFIFEFDF